MRVFLVLLIAVYSFAGYYSIQFVSAKRKVDAFYYLNKLQYKIRKFSFVYKTDSGYYTVRFLVSKNRKRLEKIAKRLPYSYVIVPDDKKKIKPYLSFTPYLYEEFVSVLSPKRVAKVKRKTYKKISKVKHKTYKKVSKVKRVVKVTKKQKPTIPNYIKMDVYLYEYNKDKIKKMLTKVEPYQKVAGYYKLRDWKNVEEEIFNMPNKDSGMYATDFDALKQSGNYIKAMLDYKNELLYSGVETKTLPYISQMVAINTKAKKVVVYKVDGKYQYGGGVVEDSKSRDLILKIVKKFHIKPVDGKVYVAYHDADMDTLIKLNSKIYVVKRDIVGVDLNYKKGRGSYELIADYSKNFLYKYKFYRLLTQILYSYQLHYNLFYTLYFKHLSYSNYITSSNEIGGNVFYGDMDNMTKKWKYFINPSVAFNDQTGFGYQVIVGANRRVIKADNLKVLVVYGKDTKEAKVVYIYYY